MGLEAASGKDPRATLYVVSVSAVWLWMAMFLEGVGSGAVCCVPVWLVCGMC